MEVRSRDGSFVVLRSDQCESFLEYIRDLSDAELINVGRDFAFLVEQNDPPFVQFVWKRDQCREECRRRRRQ